MKFTAYLVPVAKARARVCVVNGHARAFTPTKTANAEWGVRGAFLNAGGKKIPRGVPVKLILDVYRPRPARLPKREHAPVSRPDLDNYLKLVLDALNNFAWDDDAQVVQMVASKSFGDPPRVEVSIMALNEALA